MTKKDRDIAIERVGRALYGSHWIGELGTKEWKIGKSHNGGAAPITLPSVGRSAANTAAACFRSHASDLQYGQVFRWLREQGIDLHPSTFSVTAFEAWFRKKFPHVPLSATDARVKTVRAALKQGLRPGRGGNIGWKKFCDNIRARSRQHCDDRTIKRDVTAILK